MACRDLLVLLERRERLELTASLDPQETKEFQVSVRGVYIISTITNCNSPLICLAWLDMFLLSHSGLEQPPHTHFKIQALMAFQTTFYLSFFVGIPGRGFPGPPGALGVKG